MMNLSMLNQGLVQNRTGIHAASPLLMSQLMLQSQALNTLALSDMLNDQVIGNLGLDDSTKSGREKTHLN